jgi:hypothetical protein
MGESSRIYYVCQYLHSNMLWKKKEVKQGAIYLGGRAGNTLPILTQRRKKPENWHG